MGFTESVRTVVKNKYATFRGRASRSEYWWFQLFYWLVLLVLILLPVAVAALLSSGGDEMSPLFFLIMIPGGIFALAMLLPLIAVQVRRFHDRNMAGWWYLVLAVLSAIPYVGFLASLAILVISVLEGTQGPNRFGSDPLRPEATADVFA